MGILDWLTGSKARFAKRRQKVEKDGIYYCQICSKRAASKPSSGNYVTCSDVCSKAMMSGALFHGMIAFGIDGTQQEIPQRKTMYCKWCGGQIPYLSKECDNCNGT